MMLLSATAMQDQMLTIYIMLTGMPDSYKRTQNIYIASLLVIVCGSSAFAAWVPCSSNHDTFMTDGALMYYFVTISLTFVFSVINIVMMIYVRNKIAVVLQNPLIVKQFTRYALLLQFTLLVNMLANCV